MRATRTQIIAKCSTPFEKMTRENLHEHCYHSTLSIENMKSLAIVEYIVLQTKMERRLHYATIGLGWQKCALKSRIKALGIYKYICTAN